MGQSDGNDKVDSDRNVNVSDPSAQPSETAPMLQAEVKVPVDVLTDVNVDIRKGRHVVNILCFFDTVVVVLMLRELSY